MKKSKHSTNNLIVVYRSIQRRMLKFYILQKK